MKGPQAPFRPNTDPLPEPACFSRAKPRLCPRAQTAPGWPMLKGPSPISPIRIPNRNRPAFRGQKPRLLPAGTNSPRLAAETAAGPFQPINQGEPAYKPGSVEGNHSSGIHVAVNLKRPTRKRTRISAAGPVSRVCCFPIWPCSRWGLPCRQVLPPTRCALTAPFHPCRSKPLARPGLGRSALCCTFRGLAPPRRYLAPDPPEPGLSSIPALATAGKSQNSDYPAGSPRAR
jgi:hypothetical protein